MDLSTMKKCISIANVIKVLCITKVLYYDAFIIYQNISTNDA